MEICRYQVRKIEGQNPDSERSWQPIKGIETKCCEEWLIELSMLSW